MLLINTLENQRVAVTGKWLLIRCSIYRKKINTLINQKSGCYSEVVERFNTKLMSTLEKSEEWLYRDVAFVERFNT